MNILDGVCWALVPARGGSKSIPKKNIADFAGRPLIDYGVLAAAAAKRIDRIVCSTEDADIAARVRQLGGDVDDRPERLCGDATPVMDVIADFLQRTDARDGAVPEAVALVQPTSPFLLPGHLDEAVGGVLADRQAGSAQTVIPCPHNHHAVNQRAVSDGRVSFVYADERRIAYNKQTKSPHFLFGNIVVFRSAAALEQGAVFAEPSLAVEIPEAYGFDADGPDDFRLGALMLEAGIVDLPFLDGQDK